MVIFHCHLVEMLDGYYLELYLFCIPAPLAVYCWSIGPQKNPAKIQLKQVGDGGG